MRITLGGGGTDLPSYYRNHGGFLISAAVDKYVYITLHEPFTDDIIVKYSRLEVVKQPSDLQHPLVREALQLLDIRSPVEITSMSDVPAGTGLGSSGSFTTALLRSLHVLKKSFISPADLAEQACHIEIDRLGEPVGKQDPYIAAFGGITCFTFQPDDRVYVQPLALTPETVHNLEDTLVLFFTGYTRDASNILKDQDQRSRQNDLRMIENLHFVKKLGIDSKAALESGDLRGLAELMHVHWQHKKERSRGMSNSHIDELYEMARSHGALGGKVIGAGGGGFLMCYTEDRTRLRKVMTQVGLREVRFRFDFAGNHVVTHS